MAAHQVTAADILTCLTELGVPATVEQTGGGCATVYAAEAIAIGPGVYDWVDPMASDFDPAGDLFVGFDDGPGAAQARQVHTLDELGAEVVRLMRSMQ